MDRILGTVHWNTTAVSRWTLDTLSAYYGILALTLRTYCAFEVIQGVYYPILAIIGVPVPVHLNSQKAVYTRTGLRGVLLDAFPRKHRAHCPHGTPSESSPVQVASPFVFIGDLTFPTVMEANSVTIYILSRGKCGLSNCVTYYLVAMASADLLVVILDLIMRHIPIVYEEQFTFLESIPVCNIHAVLLYAATDCSVWFTVTFTFDRFVAICCQKFKSKYCTKESAASVIATVTVLSCLKNVFWYFMLTGVYMLDNLPWFCWGRNGVVSSPAWGAIEFLHYLITPVSAFVVILLLNILSVRRILVASRARKRLRAQGNVNSSGDPEMESRRKSIIVLLFISGNFILLWAAFVVFSIWIRIYCLWANSEFPPYSVQELGFMLQLLSCCTNTGLYAVTQTKFRQQLKDMVRRPINFLTKCIIK
ncbi:putative G-protein coupled receptor 139 [Rhinoraja longicauda]